MKVMRKRAVRWMVMAATAAVCVTVMGVAAAHNRAPDADDAQAAPRAVISLPVDGVETFDGLREEAGMVVAGMVLIGAAAAVRRAA